MSKTKKLRKLIRAKGIVVLPGVYDCLSAKLAEEAGVQRYYFLVSSKKAL